MSLFRIKKKGARLGGALSGMEGWKSYEINNAFRQANFALSLH